MSFTEAVKSCYNKYVTFSGRARRSEYWYFYLFTMIVGAVCGLIVGLVGDSISTFMYIVEAAACALPCLAVEIRRLHDIGKSGWWILLCIVPFVGAIILLVWSLQDSQPGDNQYGPNPKTAA